MISGRQHHGGGLAFIYSNRLRVRPLEILSSPTSFELQIVGLELGKHAGLNREHLSSAV